MKSGTIRELIGRMDSKELALWQASHALGLFGSQREERMIGTVAASALNGGRLAASAQGATFSRDPWTAADFFPGLRPKRTWAERQKEVARRLKMWRRAWCG